jgi:hypothetical protein
MESPVGPTHASCDNPTILHEKESTEGWCDPQNSLEFDQLPTNPADYVLVLKKAWTTIKGPCLGPVTMIMES